MIEDKRQVTSLSICNAHPTHRVIQALANLAIFGETPTNRFLLVRFIQQKRGFGGNSKDDEGGYPKENVSLQEKITAARICGSKSP